MTVAVDMRFVGVTLAQYDAVIEEMGYTAGMGHPDGHFHWVAKTDDGLRIVDVWDSRETFGAFAEQLMGPITARLGVPAPEITFYDLHNTLVGPRYVGAQTSA